jgi:hypothetical protein
MLEHQVLLLQACCSPPGVSGSERPQGPAYTVLDPATGHPLGFARWKPGGRSPWLRWFSPAILEVCEANDEPLVFSVHRLWGLSPRWEVRDADGHRVGLIQGRQILDGRGQLLAAVEQTVGGETVTLCDSAGELAALLRCPEGVQLTFAARVQGLPFAKMALLAAALLAE